MFKHYSKWKIVYVFMDIDCFTLMTYLDPSVDVEGSRVTIAWISLSCHHLDHGNECYIYILIIQCGLTSFISHSINHTREDDVLCL